MKFLVSIFTVLVSANAFAGGSISKEDALAKVCEKSQKICVVLNNLQLADVGEAVRLRSGERIMPYDFAAQIGGQVVDVQIQEDGDGQIVLTIR